MEERRKHIRIIESLKIVYKVIQPPDGTSECLSKDVGEGGMRFTVHQRLSPGDVLELKVSVPKVTKPIKATGRVVWVKEITRFNIRFMMGVKFIKITPFERDVILNYIQEKLRNDKSDEIGWFE